MTIDTQNNPCYLCPSRSAECHSVCARYAQFCVRNEALRTQKHRDDVIKRYISERRQKNLRRRHTGRS
jgi:hypothetical protein